MGYFSNGTEGMMYEEQYCMKCVHLKGDGCPVLYAHELYNYNECNNKGSILHILIPRDDQGDNEQCKMFIGRVESV